jgi:hypothetical protein
MDVVDIRDRSVPQAFGGSKADLDGNVPDGRRDLDDDDSRQVFVGRVA